MSYDFEIASHDEPDPSTVDRWAARQGLVFEHGVVLRRAASRADRDLFTVDGPVRAEAEDLHDEAAAACLAPQWLVTISVPASAPANAVAHAKALARTLAQELDGAAVDLQTDRRVWPRGRPKRVAPRRSAEPVDVVNLDWFLPFSRWPAAPSVLLRALRTVAPEALPKRYGRWEPPEHRFDPEAPDAFIAFLLDEGDDDGFWFASRPSFGGSWSLSPANASGPRIARLTVELDGGVLRADPRWREATVTLFATVSRELGAFFGAAQVDAGWTVTTNNRLYRTASRHGTAEYILHRRSWRGLPPVPMWLSWFGTPYRDLVAPALNDQAVRVGEGLLLRLSDLPRQQAKLGAWPVPAELAYTHEPAALIPALDGL